MSIYSLCLCIVIKFALWYLMVKLILLILLPTLAKKLNYIFVVDRNSYFMV